MAKVIFILHLTPYQNVSSALAILLLFVIGFISYNIYARFHGSPAYFHISVCPYLGYWIRAFVWILTFVDFFLHANTFSSTLSLCGFQIFSFCYFSISCCLRLLIASQFSIKGVVNIMMHTNTSWSVMACNVVVYILRTSKALADRIPDQGSSLYRWLFFTSNVCTRFAITW